MVCFFCEKTNHQGCRNVLRVEIPSFWDMKIGVDFTKLEALEARYHKTCHASNIKQYT